MLGWRQHSYGATEVTRDEYDERIGEVIGEEIYLHRLNHPSTCVCVGCDKVIACREPFTFGNVDGNALYAVGPGEGMCKPCLEYLLPDTLADICYFIGVAA
jgi:hypothetical protein